MKKVPYGLPLMTEAWISCCLWSLSEDDLKASFKKETSFDVDSLISKHPIDNLIDQATGYEREVMIAWLDWVTERVWGIEGEMPEEDESE